MKTMKTPSKRLNELLKDLKDTPYEIGALYLELLILNYANSDDFTTRLENINIIKPSHLRDLKNRINQHLITYENN